MIFSKEAKMNTDKRWHEPSIQNTHHISIETVDGLKKIYGGLWDITYSPAQFP